MPAPHLVVIGDIGREEFRLIRDWLSAHHERDEIRFHRELMTLANHHKSELSPDLIIVCQSWPDEFAARDVADVLGHWPLAQWVVCYGEWCRADGRTRSAWPIGLRVPAWDATWRLNHLWNIVSGTENNPLPITASRDEAFEFDLPASHAEPLLLGDH